MVEHTFLQFSTALSCHQLFGVNSRYPFPLYVPGSCLLIAKKEDIKKIKNKNEVPKTTCIC